ncbi:MAG: PD-(D/E)XK nuclease family protein [Candidatus Thermoplasmatota archaeon]|nr:PD-(D/E)XK nuclease family protein [Candidatus Thermoplasmatota archaeon]
MSGERQHTLSPSAWNRFETCPRMYWLSRQKLPRKAGMAASLGTAVHASIEDLLQIDLKGKDPTETHWLPDMAEKFLRARWQEEKEIFLSTPRRPSWKEKDWDKAKKMQRGAIKILLEFIGASEVTPLKTTVQMWNILLSRVIAVEGELRTQDNRLMGRLDMLFADVDSSGKLQGWVVADLKTGRAPDSQLKPEVQRQLLLYRDILLSNNPNAPPVKTEGWYTANSKRYTASGDSVLEDAFKAWEATKPSTEPLEAKPGNNSCGGFCDWKAWCPHWWTWRLENGTLGTEDFSDSVILLHHYDSNNGSGLAEICEPANDQGRAMPTGIQIPISFDGRGKEALQELLSSGHQGPIFIGSAMTNRDTWRVGHWCDVLAWSPIPDA